MTCRVAGRFQDEGWAASADVAAKEWRIELEEAQKAVGTADAEEDAAQNAAQEAFEAIVKTLKNHELAACRGLGVQELEDRLRPRAEALAAHYRAIGSKGGNACAAGDKHLKGLAAANKKLQASRLGREYKASGYVPHNNIKAAQAARRAEGIYDGADLFAALTGLGQQ